MVRLGIGIIVFAVIALIISLGVHDLFVPFSSLFCQPSEHLISKDDGEGLMTYICTDFERVNRDVTGDIVGLVITTFFVLLFVGIGLLVFSMLRPSIPPIYRGSGQSRS